MKNFSEYVKESQDMWTEASIEIKKLMNLLKNNNYEVKSNAINSLKFKTRSGYIGNIIIEPLDNKF